jgi:hypothetical protein
MADLQILFSQFEVERRLGEAPRLGIKIIFKFEDKASDDCYLHINNMPFKIELLNAQDEGTASREHNIGTCLLEENLFIPQGTTSYAVLYVPLNTLILEKIIEIRSRGRFAAFRISATIVSLIYCKKESEYIISNAIRGIYSIERITSNGKTNYILLSQSDLNQILNSVNYTEILKFETPLYDYNTSINQDLKSALGTLKIAAGHLKNGNYEGVMINVRKAITNHLTDIVSNKRVLRSSIKQDVLAKAPTEAQNTYADDLKRIEDIIRQNYKITNLFLHENVDTLRMAPLPEDAEYVYFSVSLICKYLIKFLE